MSKDERITIRIKECDAENIVYVLRKVCIEAFTKNNDGFGFLAASCMSAIAYQLEEIKGGRLMEQMQAEEDARKQAALEEGKDGGK